MANDQRISCEWLKCPLPICISLQESRLCIFNIGIVKYSLWGVTQGRRTFKCMPCEMLTTESNRWCEASEEEEEDRGDSLLEVVPGEAVRPGLFI